MIENKLKKEYIDSVIREPYQVLEFMRESEKVRSDICPSIGKEIGQFLYFMAIFSKSRRILEVGTSIGYSTSWLAMAARENGGMVDTVEVAGRLIREAESNFKELKLDSFIRCHQGYGEEILPALKKGYDLIFIDGATKSYEALYDQGLKMVKKGGLLIFEDVLFAAMAKRDIQKERMDAFNRLVMDDPRVEKSFLNVGDGLLLCMKK